MKKELHFDGSENINPGCLRKGLEKIAKSWMLCTPAFPRTGLWEGNLARHGLNECKPQLRIGFRQPIYYHLVRIAM